MPAVLRFGPVALLTALGAAVLAGCSGSASPPRVADPQPSARQPSPTAGGQGQTPAGTPAGAVFRTDGVVSPCPAATAQPGSLYVAADQSIRRIAASTGSLTTLTTTQSASSVCAIAVDRAGNILIGSGTEVQFLARTTGRAYGRFRRAGRLYTIAGSPTASRLDHSTGDGGPARFAAYGRITGLAVDAAGNILIADSGRRPCRNCDDMGSLVRVVAEQDGMFYGQRMKPGHSYTVAGVPSGIADAGHDHGPATGNSLGDTVGELATDRFGNLIIADPATPTIHPPFAPMIRVVPTRPGRYYGLRMRPGHIYTVAGNGQPGSTGDGGPATQASLAQASGVAVDRSGNLVIADATRIRVIAVRTGRFYGRPMQKGDIYSIAGTGLVGSAGDGGRASQATLSLAGLTIDPNGNLILSPRNTAEQTRLLAVRRGTFYGIPMAPLHIYSLGAGS